MRLTVRDLRVSGPNGAALLTLPAFDAQPGETIGVRGPSGAGKSTLLYALAGLTAFTGRVQWGEDDLSTLSDSARAAFRRQHIGLIFQDFLLFEDLGALANAALPAGYAPKSERAAIKAQAAAALTHLNIPLGPRRVETFSGGERQRVAVARALAANPSVILADEPTASLDRAAADHLIEDLTTLARTQGKTLIAVSHDAALHARMDRVIDLRDGRLIGDA